MWQSTSPFPQIAGMVLAVALAVGGCGHERPAQRGAKVSKPNQGKAERNMQGKGELRQLTGNKGASGSPLGPKNVVFGPHPKASPPLAARGRHQPSASELPVSFGAVRGARRQLTAEEERVIVHKGTEPAFTGAYTDLEERGTYRCKRCNTALFPSTSKFHSGCGWPSFDEALPGAVQEVPDADGRRMEIVCAACKGHLGHVFRGERMTDKDTRHCVNSVSLHFEPDHIQPDAAPQRAEAFFAGGCFWGVEYYFDKAPGVLAAESGYMGGSADTATYDYVKKGATGHAEAVRVVFDPARTTYEALARLFFEVHDPTQLNRQGPDVGTQYRSTVFCRTDSERATISKLIGELKGRGLKVATTIEAAEAFHKAEEYHQGWYDRRGSLPSCHARVRRFGDES